MSDPTPPPIEVDNDNDIIREHVTDVNVLHSPHEFLITLFQVIPEYNSTNEVEMLVKKTIGRYVMSPALLKMVRDVFTTNIDRFQC